MSIIANQAGDYVSSLTISAHFLSPDDQENSALIDFELGGIALNDPIEGLEYQPWTLRYFPATGDFVISAPNTPNTIIHNAPDVTEISLAFDQNMNPFIAYVEDTVAKFWWYDTEINDTVVSLLPANSLTPRCCTDDKRDNRDATSDIILCYVNAGALYFRQERDRYTVQYLIVDPFIHPVFELPATLKRVGMNEVNRLQWLCDLANPLDWCTYKSVA